MSNTMKITKRKKLEKQADMMLSGMNPKPKKGYHFTPEGMMSNQNPIYKKSKLLKK